MVPSEAYAINLGPVLSVQFYVQIMWLGKACVKQIPELWQIIANIS